MRIDIPNSWDDEWHVDVMKSKVSPPEKVKERINKVINKIIDRAERTYRPRANLVKEPNQDKNFWELYSSDKEKELRINRNHLLIQSIRAKLSEQDGRDLDLMLSMLELELKHKMKMVIELMSGCSANNEEETNQDELFDKAVGMFKAMRKMGWKEQDARDFVMNEECFTPIKQRLAEVLKEDNYE